MSLLECVLVAVGSAFGGLLRYGVTRGCSDLSRGFPWTTLAINVVGSFLIAALSVVIVRNLDSATLRAAARAFALVGFCGGFTTFSTFSNETLGLLSQGRYTSAGAYVILSVALGLWATFLGLKFN